MAGKKSSALILKLLVSTLIAAPALLAAESPLVRVEGLEFQCHGCVQLNEQDCQVLHGGEPLVLRCAEMLDYLIVQAGEQRSDYPPANQIIDYLVQGDVPYERARQLLWLVSERKEGLQHFLFHVQRLVRQYPHTLEELVNEGWGGETVWKVLWDEVSLEHQESTVGLRAVLAVRSPKVQLKDLIETLSVSNAVSDQVVLTTLEQKLLLLGSTWAPRVGRLRELLIACSGVAFDTSHPVCPRETLEGLEEPLRQYLQRVHVRTVLHRLHEDEQLDVQDKLRLLASTPYQEMRTPETYRVLKRVLLEIETGRATIDWQQLKDSRVGDMLTAFALDDPSLMNGLTRVITEGDSRAEARAQQESEYRRAKLALPAVNSQTAAKGWPWLSLMGVLVVLSSVVAAMFAWKRFSVEDAGSEEAALTPLQFSELHSLQAFFGLDGRATVEEFRKSYRKMARSCHPDVEGGSEQAFAELNTKYNRAQELLQQRDIDENKQFD